jgi:nucleoside-diphosphate-sugar epimerase/1-acyl-sn-glycerol-3-phosphate acyltransferase
LKYLFLVHHTMKLYNPIVIATDDFKSVDNPLIQQMLSNTNIKYISRDNFDKDEFIRFLKTEVSSNTNIMLFPEGTRSRDKTINKFKSGIYDLMMQHIDFKVLPVSITYSNVPETNGFITKILNPNAVKSSKLFGNIGITTLFKLIFYSNPTDFCAVKLDSVIQAPDSIQEVENIIVQNHHYLQNKYYKQLKLDCNDEVRCCLNHLQYSKFDNTAILDGLTKIEYDTDYNPLFPVHVDYKRMFYPVYKDLLIEKYNIRIPKQMGEYSKRFADTVLPVFEPKYILLTGATGLIGSNLLGSLIQQNKIEQYVIISRNIQKNNVIQIGNCGFHLLKGDIINIDAIDDCEFKLWNLKEIYHFAGQVTHHKNAHLIRDMIAANTKGTSNICNLIEINQTVHNIAMNVTYMSTSGVVLKEAHKFPYYKSKIDAEEYIKKHCEQHKYNLTIFRPSMVIGDVRMDILETLGVPISQPKENFFSKVKNGHVKFCINTAVNAISIGELIGCVVKAKYKSIKIYNCSGHNYKLVDIFTHYNQFNYIYVNDFFMKLLFFITSGINIMPSLHYYMRMAQYDWTIDNAKCKKDLGFSTKNLLS